MAEETGFLSQLQQSLQSFNKPANWYVELAGFLIAGFIAGFLLKHGGRFFFWLLLGAALALWALEFVHIISIDYSALKTFFGLSAQTSLTDVLNGWVTWVQGHILESLAALFGFILAWKFA